MSTFLLSYQFLISIHALREEGDSRPFPSPRSSTDFYPRPPRGGRRSLQCRAVICRFYFYPRPPRGGRPFSSVKRALSSDFYPRPPRGGRPVNDYHVFRDFVQFLSTPSARRATVNFFLVNFSVHYFYPRPPRGGRPGHKIFLPSPVIFLSTPSARRATRSAVRVSTGLTDFYPRPPRGGRRWTFCAC